jgi:glycosyltransferase involved in cell wall biosynthesis
MSLEVLERFGRAAHVLPFVSGDIQIPTVQPAVMYDYLYVASGEPHKNHHRLLQAWILLADRGLWPSLCLTLDTERDAELCVWVEELAHRHGLRISNKSFPPEQIAGLYARCGALIYPSLFESFGLPLLEARQAGLPIVAAERDYVRDVVEPAVAFDPESALSIARAVMRYQGQAVEPSMPSNAASFVLKLTELG